MAPRWVEHFLSEGDPPEGLEHLLPLYLGFNHVLTLRWAKYYKQEVRNRIDRVIVRDRDVEENLRKWKEGRKKDWRLIAIRIRDVTIRSHCISVSHRTGLSRLHESPSTHTHCPPLTSNSQVTANNVTYSELTQPNPIVRYSNLISSILILVWHLI